MRKYRRVADYVLPSGARIRRFETLDGLGGRMTIPKYLEGEYGREVFRRAAEVSKAWRAERDALLAEMDAELRERLMDRDF